MWRQLASSKRQEVTDQDEMPTQSTEFKTFDSLYSLINGPSKVRIMVKDQILRIPSRLIDIRLIEQKVRKQVIAALLSQESTLASINDVQVKLQEMLIQSSEEQEKPQFSVLNENFISARNNYMERLKIRGIDNFIMGAHVYLTQFNDGDQKSELVENLIQQVQTVYDSHITENKLTVKFSPY